VYASNMEIPQREWIASLNEKISTLISGVVTDPLVIQYEVMSNSSEGYVYHLTLLDGAASIQEGKSEQVDITFSLEETTASQIQAGSLNTEEAFLKGLLTIDGDVKHLLDIHHQIESSNI